MDLDTFVADCVTANNGSGAQMAIKEVLERYVSNPTQVLKDLGEPTKAGIIPIHRSADLTIFNAVWTPQMNLMPHNHLMWANIGIYTGREDNIIWKYTDDGIEAYGAEALILSVKHCGHSVAVGGHFLKCLGIPPAAWLIKKVAAIDVNATRKS